MPSEDEDDLNHFLTQSSDINFSTNHGIVSDNDSISTDDFSQSPTLNLPQYETYLNLSSSGSETSLARPLLNAKHQSIPIYTTENIQIKSPKTPINYYSFLKLYLTDMFISAFIITPFVNIHWRGAWDLIDIYLLPKNERLSSIVSLSVGLFIIYIIYLTQNSLQTFYEKYRNKLPGQIMTRLYTLIIALAYINQWRGLWSLLDSTSNTWYHLLIETCVSIIFLLLMKSIYNLNSAPFLIAIDTESYFLLGSKYNISVS
jgi:succinate dehydrogenase hydrophobic anchor subunit